jgi:hypothetical protein
LILVISDLTDFQPEKEHANLPAIKPAMIPSAVDKAWGEVELVLALRLIRTDLASSSALLSSPSVCNKLTKAVVNTVGNDDTEQTARQPGV